jgi:hypothetical protein
VAFHFYSVNNDITALLKALDEWRYIRN